MKGVKKFVYKGKNFIAITTKKIRTSYGYAGSSGVRIMGEDGESYGKFKNITEFKRYTK